MGNGNKATDAGFGFCSTVYLVVHEWNWRLHPLEKVYVIESMTLRPGKGSS